MKIKNEVTLEEFKEYLSYNPDAGEFTWIKKPSQNTPIGKAGYKEKNKYYRITFKLRRYYAHRLAWFFVYGEWPKHDIDHINGKPDDNRIINLRDVSTSQNLKNQKIHRGGKLPGAYYDKRRKKWYAQIAVNKKKIHLGMFFTQKEALSAYSNFCKENNL